MKIMFLTNYYNHHQSCISQAFNKICDVYKFIATGKMREDRRRLGYGEDNVPEYVIDCSDENSYNQYVNEIDDCDVVIIGSAPESLIKSRRKKHKLVFRYNERPLKNGNSILKYPHRWYNLHKKLPTNEKVYMLCSSAYTSSDFAKFGMYKSKCYKWGYFPECKKYENINDLLTQKEKNHILWCGRFLSWKHPDIVIEVAKKLRAEKYDFCLDFVGTGPLKDEMHRMIKEYDLVECVHILSPMKPAEVRLKMEKAGIYLFTSDRQEGWGAVLNESMNSGCAVVASHAIGSVPFLLKDNENGLVFESENTEELYKKVRYLLDNPDEQMRLGLSAYNTIVDEWNADVAAERLLNLSKYIINGGKNPQLYKTGPCSIAEIIKDNWYRSKNDVI